MLFKLFGKRIQKKEKGKGALAGRGLASGPLAEAGPAHTRSPPPRARASAASTRADGRAATPWHAGSVRPPRGAHAATWTRHGRPPGVPGRVRLRPCCQTRSSARSLARAKQQPHRRSPLLPMLGALLHASSSLLPPIRDHQRLRVALPHPALALNRAR